MHVTKLNLNGNPNIGLYGYVTDSYCLLGKDVPNSLVDMAKEIFQVPVHTLNIAGTSLLGIFLAGNENCLLVPEITLKTELKLLDDLGIKYEIIKSDLTALGNNISANENGCMISPEYSEETREQIEEALGVKTHRMKIHDIFTVGSIIAKNKKGCAIHRDIQDKEKSIIEEIFQIPCSPTTLNMGNPYIGSGVLVNTNGFIVGDLSGGPEVVYLDEIFGFIEG